MIVSFVAEPEEIDLGQTVTLTWEFTGTSLVDARLLRNGEQIRGDLVSPGTVDDTPPSGLIEYTLVVDSEFSGSTEQSVFVTVNQVEVVPQSSLDIAWFNLWSMLVGENID